MHNIASLKKKLSTPRKIVLTTHQNPDGDAMGSCLALYHFFKMQGHQVSVITPTDFAVFLEWMPGSKDIITFPDHKEEAKEFVAQAELIFCLDFNHLNRLQKLGHEVDEATAEIVLIDHHLHPANFATYEISDSNVSSTCEMIYEFIELLDGGSMINRDIATCLYVGIMTDTGSFRFSTTTSRVHRITARLLDFGIDPDEIYNHIDNSFTENRLRFYGYCLTKKMKVLPEYKTAYISVTKKELWKFKIGTGDTEGLVNFPLKMKDIIFSALITDRNTEIRLSFRSKGDFDVSKIAREHFDGGGHKNAAGGTSKLSLEETNKKFEALLQQLKEYLCN